MFSKTRRDVFNHMKTSTLVPFKEPSKARARSIQGKPVRIGGNLREYKSLKELENINAASCAENFSAITPFLISIAQIRRERPRLCFTQRRGLPRIGRIISFDLL